MGFDEGQVIFDRKTYFAGQTVHGKLVFEQKKIKPIRSLHVIMKGYCSCHWTTRCRASERTEHYTMHHSSHESYYERKICLMGKKSGEGESYLYPGPHEFAFQCHIPPHCPSSFEGSNGHIRYEFKFVVDRAFMLDQEKFKTITVIARRDLNADPYCKEPMEFEFRESYRCCCVGAGSCNLTVKLPHSGFCPGQIIPIEVSCANKSNLEINSIKFALNEDITFRATSEPDTRSKCEVISQIKKGPILGNTTRNWTLKMKIPEMDLYNVDSCQFIDIDYEFEVRMSPSACHEGTSATKRIVLGHVPLRDSEVGPPEQIDKTSAELQQYPAPNQPCTNSPHPVANPPYPCTNPPYVGAKLPYPSNNPPYPDKNPPYPDMNPPYPGMNAPYPHMNPPYPSTNPPYPHTNPPYPNTNPPYPRINPPHQGANPPYPDSNLPFPGTNPPYPGVNPPYSDLNPPYPAANPPYIGPNPVADRSCSGGSPLPEGNQAFPVPSHVPPSLGFTVSNDDKNDSNVTLLPPGAFALHPITRFTENPFAAASAPYS